MSVSIRIAGTASVAPARSQPVVERGAARSTGESARARLSRLARLLRERRSRGQEPRGTAGPLGHRAPGQDQLELPGQKANPVLSRSHLGNAQGPGGVVQGLSVIASPLAQGGAGNRQAVLEHREEKVVPQKLVTREGEGDFEAPLLFGQG